MKPILHNLKGITVLALLAFSTASSGVTTVLHQCAMTATPIDCCGSTAPTHEDVCEIVLPPGTVAVGSDFSCHINTLVGGVGVQSALLKVNDNSTSPKPDALVTTIAAPDANDASVSHELFVIQRVLHPHAVHTYILNSSLLI